MAEAAAQPSLKGPRIKFCETPEPAGRCGQRGGRAKLRRGGGGEGGRAWFVCEARGHAQRALRLNAGAGDVERGQAGLNSGTGHSEATAHAAGPGKRECHCQLARFVVQAGTMQNPYIPAQDAQFDSWLVNFSTLLTASPTTYGLTSGDATTVAGVTTAWSAAYLAATDPSTRTSVTIAAKDAARTTATQTVRPLATQISRNPAVDNGDKTAIGVNLPNTARTPIPPPTTVPGLTLVSAIHFQHTLSYKDTSTPTTKAKPAGAIGLDLRVTIQVGAASDPEAAKPWTVATKSPVIVSFTAPDVAKTATYWGRWATRSGPGGQAQYGDWSAPLSVVIV